MNELHRNVAISRHWLLLITFRVSRRPR